MTRLEYPVFPQQERRETRASSPRLLRERGVALVITLIMLSVITFLTVAFLALSRRDRASVTTSLLINVVGEVDGCDVLLVDDITETAGTLTAAAKILREHGARSVRAAVSHCILNEVTIDRLKSGLIDELITTNSTPINTHGIPVTVLSVASLLGQAIQRINSNESVTGLFRVKGF